MSQRRVMFAMLGVVLVVASIHAIAQQQETEPLGFFITSVGPYTLLGMLITPSVRASTWY